MANPTAVLSTNRYVPAGVVIGQLMTPQPVGALPEVRIPAYIGVGNRLIELDNMPIIRAFVNSEPLSFTPTPPYIAELPYVADGSQLETGVQIVQRDGTILQTSNWNFTSNELGVSNGAVMINPEIYNNNIDYTISYQSIDPTVQDPLPTNDIRAILSVGNQQDQQQYTEYVNYVIPIQLSTITGDVHPISVSTIVTNSANIGTGSISFDAASTYLHAYNRFYTLAVASVTGGVSSAIVTFNWSSQPLSGGNSADAPTPLYGGYSNNLAPSFVVYQTNAASQVQYLENGLKVDLSNVAHFVTNDQFYFDAVGPTLIEYDSRLSNTNQYLQSEMIAATGTGGITLNVTDYEGTYNINFQFEVAIRTVNGITVNWAQYGSELGPSGQFNVIAGNTNSFSQPLTLGVVAEITTPVTAFMSNDIYQFAVQAPAIYCQNLDDRDYVLQITSSTNPTNEGYIAGTWVTNTPEGGYGTFSAEANLVWMPPLYLSVEYVNGMANGHFALPSNVQLVARNLVSKYVPNQFVVGNNQYFTLTNSNVIDWTLTNQATETIQSNQVYFDQNGAVTGTPGLWYCILHNVPITGSLSITANGIPVTFIDITGTVFVSFATQPTSTLTITYNYAGQQPPIGQIYYMSATYLRPLSYYNSIQLIQSRGAGRNLLQPSTISNNLYIMNEIAWDNGVVACIFVQVYDADQDGIYTLPDFQTALNATVANNQLTDRIVLSFWEILQSQLAVNVAANDPFAARESLDWFGMPIGTIVGDINTPNSLVYTAQRTLQVYGDSPSQGTRILVSPTTCQRTIALSTGISQQVTLDGSFVAGALAALTASFTNPATDLLRKFVAGFDTIQTYQDPDNITLGANNIVYITNQGGAYRIDQDVTVSSFSPDAEQINNMTQKEATTRAVRTQLDALTVGVVPPTPSSGDAIIQSALTTILTGRVSNGLLAPYQDANGNPRPFNPDTDIVVFVDTTKPTLYHFAYTYYLENVIKQLWGLYTVQGQSFGIGA